MTDNQAVELCVENSIAYVTLNRPDKHNAFDDGMIAELTKCFEAVANQTSIRAMVLRAKGKSFSAGADLRWMQRMADYSREENQRDAMGLATMLQTLNELPKPTIAMVQGAAFGGAVGLVACCDMAVASDVSKFCLSEVKIGLIPATISPYVVEAIGARVSRRYFQTAEAFSAEQAYRLGLVSELVKPEELESQVQILLNHLLKNGPQAVAKAKSLVSIVKDKSIDSELMQQTSQLIADIRVSQEGQGGLHAFINKHPAPWMETIND